MKKLITGILLLTTVSAFANSELTRLAGSWKGTFADKKMTLCILSK